MSLQVTFAVFRWRHTWSIVHKPDLYRFWLWRSLTVATGGRRLFPQAHEWWSSLQINSYQNVCLFVVCFLLGRSQKYSPKTVYQLDVLSLEVLIKSFIIKKVIFSILSKQNI